MMYIPFPISEEKVRFSGCNSKKG